MKGLIEIKYVNNEIKSTLKSKFQRHLKQFQS